MKRKEKKKNSKQDQRVTVTGGGARMREMNVLLLQSPDNRTEHVTGES